MKLAIVNPITQTLNYPTEKEPQKPMETDEYCNVIELAKAIASLANNVTVFVSDAFKPKKAIAKNPLLTVKYLPTRLKTIMHPAVLPYCPTLSAEIKKGKFDAIIATDHYQISTMQAALAKQKKAKLLLWQELDRDFKPFLQRQLQKAYNKTLFRLVEKKVDLFIPRSKSAKAFLECICKNKQKISDPVPTPVDTAFFKPKKTKPGNFVLDVTRLNSDRGLDFLVETVTRTKKILPRQQFVVAGSGPKKAWLEKKILEKGLFKNVKLVCVSKKQMPLLYNKSALSIIHSTGGFFPFTALESMSCGKQVVSSFKGALLDLIEEEKNGFFVDTPKQMAERIAFLLKNKRLLTRLGKNARKKIEKEFSMQKIAEKFIKKIGETA